MAYEFELKQITPESIDAAIARAKHYRYLNQPVQARSICHDILAVDPDNQEALAILILAIADDFRTGVTAVNEAKEHASRLTDEYEQRYYNGLIAERRARALLAKGPSAAFAHDVFLDAMEWYEKAQALHPEGNDDAILRWNSCVRTIRDENLKPRRPDDREHGLE